MKRFSGFALRINNLTVTVGSLKFSRSLCNRNYQGVSCPGSTLTEADYASLVHGRIDSLCPSGGDPSNGRRPPVHGAIANRNSIQWLIKPLPSVYNVHVLILSLYFSSSQCFNQTARSSRRVLGMRTSRFYYW